MPGAGRVAIPTAIAAKFQVLAKAGREAVAPKLKEFIFPKGW